MMFDRKANTMTIAVIATSRDTAISMKKRTGPCRHVAIPELGSEAFGEHSCTKGNGNAVNINVWKNGRQASILFAPVKPHPESGSVERLKGSRRASLWKTVTAPTPSCGCGTSFSI